MQGQLIKQTILVVEDDDGVRYVVELMVARLGYTVLSARDGQHALDISASYDGPIDVLLTDVVMQGMSGPELAQQLRTNRPALKCVFMSGYPAEDVERRMPAGEKYHLINKPFTLEQLAECLAKVE